MLGWCVLLCVLRASAGLDSADELPTFTIQRWPIFTVGESAARVLRYFVISSPAQSTTEIFKAGIRDGKKFFGTVLRHILQVQVQITLLVVLGIIICFVLILLPYYVSSYRTKQLKLYDKAEPFSESSTQVWIIFQIFLIFSVVALFGAVALCIASIHIKLSVHEMFRFANYSLDLSFTMARILERNYLYRINDVSRSALQSVSALSEVNREVGRGYANGMLDKMRPVLQIAQSIEWDILQAKEQLEYQSSELANLANSTVTEVGNRLQSFKECLGELKETLNGNDSWPLIDSLLEIEPFEVSGNVADLYGTPIALLANLSSVNFQSTLRHSYEELLRLPSKTFYDSSPLKLELQEYVYHTEQKISTKVEQFITFVKEHVTEENRQFLKVVLEYIRKDIKPSVVSVAAAIYLFGVVSVALSSAKLISFVVALIGTKGFNMEPERRFTRSPVSNCGGGLLIFTCYAIVCVLWLYWAFGLLLFFTSTLPNLLCQSTKDLAILDVTVDHPSIRKECGWFYMFSSTEFNTTMKQNIENCRRDSSHFAPLPDTLVERRDFVFHLNVTEARLLFEHNLQSIVTFNGSQSIHPPAESSMDILDQLNTRSFFLSLKAYVRKLTRAYMELSDWMEERADFPEKAVLCTDALDSLIGNLSVVLSLEKGLNVSRQRMNVTLERAFKQMDHLEWTSDGFYAYASKNGGHDYETILVTYLAAQIDGIFFDLSAAFKRFRKSISLCKVLSILQSKGQEIFCYNLLLPVAISWLGFVLISIFQLFNVILVVPCCRMFEYYHRTSTQEVHRENHQKHTIHREDENKEDGKLKRTDRHPDKDEEHSAKDENYKTEN